MPEQNRQWDVQPSLDDVRAHYDEWNAQCRDGEFEDIDFDIRIRGERVVEILRERATVDSEILEIGCGTGWMSKPLGEFGRVTGIDLSPRAIEIAQRRHPEHRFVAADFLEMPAEPPLAPESYDVAVCMETLFYVQDQAGMIERTAQLLRPGGRLLLTCINEFVYRRRSDIGPPHPGQPRHWLPIVAIENLLKPRFELLRVETVLPGGDQGILKVANSYKVNQVLNGLFGEPRVRRAKERLRWGSGVIIEAKRR